MADKKLPTYSDVAASMGSGARKASLPWALWPNEPAQHRAKVQSELYRSMFTRQLAGRDLSAQYRRPSPRKSGVPSALQYFDRKSALQGTPSRKSLLQHLSSPGSALQSAPSRKSALRRLFE